MPSQGLKGVLMLPASNTKLAGQIKGLVGRGTAALKRESSTGNQVAGAAGAAGATALAGGLASWRQAEDVMGLDVRLLGAGGGHLLKMMGKVKGKAAAAAEGAANGLLGSLTYDSMKARAARYYAEKGNAPAPSAPPAAPVATPGGSSEGRQILWSPPADLAAAATAGADFIDALPI